MGRLVASGLAVLALAGCGDATEKAYEAPAVNTGSGAAEPARAGKTALRYEMLRLDGTREQLSKYRGKVVLIVNTATECGFTPQLEGLQALYESRRRDGLVLLGFPSNDFAGQEPRSNKAIGEFCTRNYGVTFPMFGKTTVVGDDATPLFRQLGAPSWNFNKYLLDRRGRLRRHYDSSTAPDDPALTDRVDALLRRT